MKFLTSIQGKIWLCVGVAFIGLAFATGSTYYANNKLSGNLAKLRGYDYPVALKGIDLVNSFQEQVKLYEDAFLLGEEESVEQGDRMTGEITAMLDEMVTLSRQYGVSGAGELQDIKKDYQVYAALASNNYQAFVSETGFGTIQESIQKAGQMRGNLSDRLDLLAAALTTAVEVQIEESRTISKDNITFILVLFVVVIIISVFAINIVAKRLLIRPLNEIKDMVRTLASGQLGVTFDLSIKDKGEIGDLASSMREMAEKLQQVVVDVQSSAMNVTSASQAMSSSTEQMSQGATEQASVAE
jgi:methyl-accepting chemotaxis protein